MTTAVTPHTFVDYIATVIFFCIAISPIVGLFMLINYFSKPICFACGKRIMEKMYAHIGPPLDVTIHDNDECTKKAYEIINSDSYYVDRTEQYIRMLDRKDSGNPPSKDEWKNFWRE